MQIGENLAEGVASAPAPLNLAPLKVVENVTRAVSERVKAIGGRVGTRTLLQIETRSVGGKDVPVLLGIQRQSWIVMPGTDKTFQFVDFAASVDPVTRFATVQRLDIRKPAKCSYSGNVSGVATGLLTVIEICPLAAMRNCPETASSVTECDRRSAWPLRVTREAEDPKAPPAGEIIPGPGTRPALPSRWWRDGSIGSPAR
jgi:hypothetical protein